MSGSLPPEGPNLPPPPARNIKRRLTPAPPNANASESQDMDATSHCEADGSPEPVSGAWTGPSLASKLRSPPPKPPLYIGEDCMEDGDSLDLSNLVDPMKVIERDLAMPVIDFSLEECQQLWRPWRKALILKLLGKTVSFRILEQRTKDLWKLEWGCELIDLEKGFYVARFYSEADYIRVLEGGPWIIMGHYLTVMKWKPNFRPSLATITSTLVWICLPEVPLEYFNEPSLRPVLRVVCSWAFCSHLCGVGPLCSPHPYCLPRWCPYVRGV